MATYSNNTTIKIGPPVAIYRNQIGPGSASDSFTVPSGCYLMLTRANKSTGPFGGSASLTVTYPGFPSQALDIPTSFQYDSSPDTNGINPFAVLLPSGSVINASLAVSETLGFATYQVLGQLYQNTP